MSNKLKFFSYLICITCCLSFFCPSYCQLGFGATAGGALSNVSLKTTAFISGDSTRRRFESDPNSINKRKAFKTYYAGIIGEIELGNVLALRPGLFYIYKGWDEINYTGSAFTIKNYSQHYRVHSFMLPVTLLFSAPAADGKIYIGTGPYAAYEIKGTYKKKSRTGSTIEMKNISFEDNAPASDEKANRLDYGLNSVLGYEFKFGLFLELGYELGMKEFFKEKDPGVNTKFNIFKLGCGLLLHKKNTKKQT